jgi:hypothetical protein
LLESTDFGNLLSRKIRFFLGWGAWYCRTDTLKSEKLINKLDDFLGNPTEDPHGDPIPNAEGQILKIDKQLLSELTVGKAEYVWEWKILHQSFWNI